MDCLIVPRLMRLLVSRVLFRDHLLSGYIKIGEVEMSNRPTVYSARNLCSTKIIWIMPIMHSPAC